MRPIAGFPRWRAAPGRVGDERVALFRVQQQGDHSFRIGRSWCRARRPRLEDRGEHLLLGQRPALVGRPYQVGDRILARAARLRASSPVRYRTMLAEAATASAGGSGADDGASSV